MYLTFELGGLMKKKAIISVLLLSFVILNACSIDRKILGSSNGDPRSKFQLYKESNNLILSNERKTYILASDLNYELAEEQPKMHWISRGEREYILITIVWMTNNIGSSVSMWLYDCLNEEIQTIDDGLETVDYFVQKNGSSYVLEIPQYHLKLDVDIVPVYEDVFPDRGTLEFSRFINYRIESNDTIVLERKILTGAMDWLDYKTLSTVYDIDDGLLVPLSFSIN